MEGSPAAGSGNFADVASGSYYANAVSWAQENGIVKGTSDKSFSPDQNISREQMAAVFYRHLGYKGFDYVVTGEYILFADDVQISDYAKEAIQILYKLEILQGTENNAINPQGTATRAEAATLLQRLLGQL